MTWEDLELLAVRAGVDPVEMYERFTLGDVMMAIEAWHENRRDFRYLVATMTAHVVNAWGPKTPATPELLLGEKKRAAAGTINGDLVAAMIDRQARPKVQEPSQRKKRAAERNARAAAGGVAPPPPPSTEASSSTEGETPPPPRRRKRDLSPEQRAELEERKAAWRRTGGAVG